MHRYQIMKEANDEFTIREVYLDANGDIEGYSPDIILRADSVAELRTELKKIIKDIDLFPILDDYIDEDLEEFMVENEDTMDSYSYMLINNS